MAQEIVILATNGENVKATYGSKKTRQREPVSMEASEMGIPIEKYIDTRFSYIEENIKSIHSDIKDQNKKIDSLKYWILGTFLALAALFFAVVGYHTMVMQSQFQVFSDYVKAVTQPQVAKPPLQSK